MNRTGLPRSPVFALTVLATLVVSACGATATTSPQQSPTAPPSATATPSPTPLAVTPEPIETGGGLTSEGKVLIRWFVGLGAGGQPAQIEKQQAVVKAFNDSQDEIKLALEIYQNDVAYDTLSTQIAAGQAPDIVGPVGFRGLTAYAGDLLDQQPYIENANYDLSVFDPGLLKVYEENLAGKTIIPFGIYPAFMYYNKDLFDEAGLPYPPHKVGEAYQGAPWDYEAVREIGRRLTVDENGNDATSPAFDPSSITQFGFYPQWSGDPRRTASEIGGSGSVVAADGRTAQFPDNWRQGYQWFYDGIWKDRFIPDAAYQGSELLSGGNVFQSGNVAMAYTHLWYTCCILPAEGQTGVKNWDIAVAPISFNGETTSNLHADTFAIIKTTKHPDEAFEVLSYLLGSKDLLTLYGALPAQQSLQADFFKTLDERFAPNEVDWQVVLEMVPYAERPSHEASMPNFLKADAALKSFDSRVESTDGLDIGAEIDGLVGDLQSIFDE